MRKIPQRLARYVVVCTLCIIFFIFYLHNIIYYLLLFFVSRLKCMQGRCFSWSGTLGDACRVEWDVSPSFWGSEMMMLVVLYVLIVLLNFFLILSNQDL